MAESNSVSNESGYSEESDIEEKNKKERMQQLRENIKQPSPADYTSVPRRTASGRENLPRDLPYPYSHVRHVHLSGSFVDDVNRVPAKKRILFSGPPFKNTPWSRANTDPEEPEHISSTTKSCLCSKNVIHELRTQRGFRLLDVLDTITDVFAFKIQFQGYPRSSLNINKRFRRVSVSQQTDIGHHKMNIPCRSTHHSLFDEKRIYSLRKLLPVRQHKDINCVKFVLMLAGEDEIKSLCKVLYDGNPDREIRQTIEEVLKRRFYRRYKNKFKIFKIWLGNKANALTSKYHLFPEKSCFDTVVIIVEQNIQRVTQRSICGFHLVIVSENEYDTEAQRLLQYESQKSTELSIMPLAKDISDLMNDHSNITLINTSSIRSKRYNTEDFQIKRTPAIVIYCQVKGIIPFGEQEFPVEINGFPVDVREGTCDYAGKKIRLSEQISAEECMKFGTLGGFIDLQPGKAFLTCAHVVQPTNVLRNNAAQEYARRREIKVFDQERREIGKLKRAVFNHGQPTEVSVDAAIVEITDTSRYPCDGNFADVFSDNQLNGAGFSREQRPHFSNGQIEQISTFNFRKQVIKVGASSGITVGWLRMGRSCAQIIDDCDVKIDGSFPVRLFGQFEVLPRIDPSQPTDSQQPFVSGGDSGALVFAICNENPIVLKCIGIVVAKTSYGACLMTPIDKVLDALDLPYSCFSKFSIPSNNQQTESEDLRSLLTSITQQLTVMQSNMATKSDIGNLKSDLEKINDRLTMAEEEIQSRRAAGKDYGQ